MLRFLSFFLLVGCFWAGCKSNPPLNAENNSLKLNQNAQISPDSHVVISFFSKGGGIDTKAREKTDAFIADFNLKNKTNLVAETYRWGREGEVDYCINVLTLKKDLNALFRQNLTDLLSKNELVRLEFNAICTRKR